MQIKLILKNILKKPAQYITLCVLEVLFISMLFVSNGIMLDNMAKESNIAYRARAMEYKFCKPLAEDEEIDGEQYSVLTSDIRDEINELLQTIPHGLLSLELDILNPDDYYHTYIVRAFPSYEAMVKHTMENHGLKADSCPTETQFYNREKTVIVGSDAGGEWIDGEYVPRNFVFNEKNHLILHGEEYQITGYSNARGIVLLWETEPADVRVKGFYLEMENPITQKQAEEVNQCITNVFGDQVYQARDVETADMMELRMCSASILMSIIIQVLVSFNLILIFRMVLLERQKDYAVLRLCGYTKLRCVLFCAAELFLVFIPSAVLGCLVFDLAVKPVFQNFYSSFSFFFTFDYYALMCLLFTAVCAVMYCINVLPTFRRSVTQELMYSH